MSQVEDTPSLDPSAVMDHSPQVARSWSPDNNNSVAFVDECVGKIMSMKPVHKLVGCVGISQIWSVRKWNRHLLQVSLFEM